MDYIKTQWHEEHDLNKAFAQRVRPMMAHHEF